MASEQPPTIARQGSIGSGNSAFAVRLAEAQAASANDEMMHPAEGAEDDEPEWLHWHENKMQPAPQASQEMEEEYHVEAYDDRELVLLDEKYATLNAKTFRMKDLMAKREMHELKAGQDPYELMSNMYETIEAMPEGEDKNDSIHVWNGIYTIFETGRKNANLRAFLADLFPAQRDFYLVQKEKREIADELRMLSKLYDEQELEQTMKALKEKQEKRKASIEAKAVAKAVKVCQP